MNNPLRRRDIRPDISIIDFTVPVVAATNSASSIHISSSSAATKTTTHRKLRRFNGDIRARIGSNVTSCHCSISVGAALFLLIARQLLAVSTVEAAYLSEKYDSKLPVTTTTPAKPNPNQRYAFLTRPKDKYFTSTGILPSLSPSVEKEDLRKILPSFTTPTPSNDDEEETISVTYTNDPKSVDRWLCKNLPYDGCFLGFDIERVPESRSMHIDQRERSLFAHVAVVQLATANACLVVQLVDTTSRHCSLSSVIDDDHHHHPKHNHNPCARILRSVLEDPSIVKVGCSIDEDLVLLHEVWGGKTTARQTTKKVGSSKNEPHHHHPKPKKQRVAVVKTNGNHRHQSYSHGPALQARSRFDLGCVVLPKKKPDLRYTPFLSDCEQRRDGENKHHNNNEYRVVAKKTTTINNKSGLQGLCKAMLGVDLPKEQENCASDWTRFPLTDDQITYAARDAWAGAAIATKLAAMEFETNPSSMNENGNSNNVFSRCNLIKVLRRAETPLPQLAQRHRQRKDAKIELKNLLHPYSKTMIRNKEKFLRHHEQQQQQAKTQPIIVPSSNTHKHIYTNGTTIHNGTDVDALFPPYPITSPRSLFKYAQKQQLLMENSLPKDVRERIMVLRQIVNAKVIDHRVVFDIDLVHPGEETAKGEENLGFEPETEKPRQQKGCKRRRNCKTKNSNKVSTRSHR